VALEVGDPLLPLKHPSRLAERLGASRSHQVSKVPQQRRLESIWTEVIARTPILP
jgi:hypothetical protein